MVEARESYPYKILIVDNEVEIRHLIATFLSSKGHICEHASDGNEVILSRIQGIKGPRIPGEHLIPLNP